MSDPRDWYKLDRTAFDVVSLDEQDNDVDYWRSRSVDERLRALEYLRRMAYGDAATQRLQRVLTVGQLGED